jgi:GT2 family glycosyltransferase
MSSFAVLITSYNRAEKTIRCIETLMAESHGTRGVAIEIFLLDDGSTDATGDKVGARFPQVNLIHGDGSLFWAGGMREAWGAAENKGAYDFFVWVNDDVEFNPAAAKRAFERAIQLHADRNATPTILVGCILDPDTGEITYSGVNRPSPVIRPLYFERVIPSGAEVECETFNGNFVIIPAAVVQKIGRMNPAYVHAYGDYDYGFRAHRAGFKCVVLADPVGTCNRNPWVDPVKIRSMSLSQRWRRMLSPKLYPIPGWYVYARAHTGPFWPLFFFRPYWEVLFPWAFSRLR